MRLVSLILLLTLAGCQKDFDSQYAETERKVKAAEAKIDAEMAEESKRDWEKLNDVSGLRLCVAFAGGIVVSYHPIPGVMLVPVARFDAVCGENCKRPAPYCVCYQLGPIRRPPWHSPICTLRN